jgi:hypothetical protein
MVNNMWKSTTDERRRDRHGRKMHAGDGRLVGSFTVYILFCRSLTFSTSEWKNNNNLQNQMPSEQTGRIHTHMMDDQILTLILKN